MHTIDSVWLESDMCIHYVNILIVHFVYSWCFVLSNAIFRFQLHKVIKHNVCQSVCLSGTLVSHA